MEKQDAWAQLFMKILLSALQASVNIADTRTWNTLPKEFQFCRIPTPPDRKIKLSGPNGESKVEVTIGDGTVNLIYVKSISANSPLLVTQVNLNGTPTLTTNPSQLTSSDTTANASPAKDAETTTAATSTAGSASPAITPAPSPAAVPVVKDSPATVTPKVSDPVRQEMPVKNTPGRASIKDTISDPKVEKLCESLEQDNPGKVKGALNKLRDKKLKDNASQAVPKILPCLANSKPDVVCEALKTLAAIGNPDAVPAILPLLTNERPDIVREACRTLADIGNKDTIPSIEPLLTNPRSDIRNEAYKAIAKLQAKP
jgi:hypothetical protein